jgi:hypothetical protein
MMHTTFLLVCVMASSLNATDLDLCARIGALQRQHGQAVVLGENRAPAHWGFRRDARYQLCTANGRAVERPVTLTLKVEPLDGDFGQQRLYSRTVATDERGRFSAVYGGGNTQAGAIWPAGTVTREVHRFLLQDREIAAFVLELSADGLEIGRTEAPTVSKNLQDPRSGQRYAERYGRATRHGGGSPR